MTDRIPLFPEVDADLKAATEAAIWKPTTIEQIARAREIHCDNCFRWYDDEFGEYCHIIESMALGYALSDEQAGVWKVNSAGVPSCSEFVHKDDADAIDAIL